MTDARPKTPSLDRIAAPADLHGLPHRHLETVPLQMTQRHTASC